MKSDKDMFYKNSIQDPYEISSSYNLITGLPDIDYTIFNQANDYNISNQLYHINKYTRNLYNNKNFWINKIKNEDLYIPENLFIDDNIDYGKLYEAAKLTQDDMNVLSQNFGLIIIDTISNPKFLQFLFDKSNINNNVPTHINYSNKTAVVKLNGLSVHNEYYKNPPFKLTYNYYISANRMQLPFDSIQNFLFYYHFYNNTEDNFEISRNEKRYY